MEGTLSMLIAPLGISSHGFELSEIRFVSNLGKEFTFPRVVVPVAFSACLTSSSIRANISTRDMRSWRFTYDSCYFSLQALRGGSLKLPDLPLRGPPSSVCGDFINLLSAKIYVISASCACKRLMVISRLSSRKQPTWPLLGGGLRRPLGIGQ
ncbi:hypothetical protein Acr_28g0006150 [Actinidia rufa]|uniref:Uncharacterized protein n=1 Tax=Actinidia rufa TaxID=165716 RepID=A0A7J0H9V8_9ERIC|nr:hypothetical protein Acr_28g0006150 [Actinidia rufa]